MLRRLLLALLISFIFTPHAFADAVCANKYAALDADFPGARMSSCEAQRRNFILTIEPENTPINPSPWYAFRVTPKQDARIKVMIRYSESAHRYPPKISEDGQTWALVPPSRVKERRKGKRVSMSLALDDKPFIVAAQEMLQNEAYDIWMQQFVDKGVVRSEIIGESVEGRSIAALISTPAEEQQEKETVVLISRQHPPEIPGALAMASFLETVLGDTPLAEEFRKRFEVIAIPILNPDGVEHGHWRHNVNGVDLNRDWGPFTQPETQAVKKIFDDIAEDENRHLRLMFDFHSTRRNVFYTQTSEDVTNPPKFTKKWLERARARINDYEFDRDERPLSERATSKNYVFERFGAPAVTYEVGDNTDRATIGPSAIIFAEEMMWTLLSYDPDILND